MKSKDFLGFIQKSLKDYSEDPWIFLRELAQNSRDAGATKIFIDARRAEGWERISFQDNGRGLSLPDARDYLFKLFASNKADDQESAGLFGIGFWSVTRFNPGEITIESYPARGDKWALMVNRDFEIRKIPCGLSRPGTGITLRRPAVYEEENRFVQAVREAVLRHCRYLRVKSTGLRELRVSLNGQRVSSKRMRPTVPFAVSFRGHSHEGFVGIDRRPLVKIFSQGLLVWEGISLSEFFTHQSPKFPHDIDGLSPVVYLNSNRLKVDITRRRVVENHALKKLIRQAQSELQNLIRFNAENPGRLKVFSQIGSFLRNLYYSVKNNLWWSAAFLVFLVSVTLLAWKLTGNAGREGPGDWFQLGEYSASVNQWGAGESRCLIRSPEYPQVKLSLYYADHYDLRRGFLRDRSGDFQSLPATAEDSPVIPLQIDHVETVGRESSRFFLPCPVGYVVLEREFTINRDPVAPFLFHLTNGEFFISLKRQYLPLESLRYRCVPRPVTRLAPLRYRYYTRLPEEIRLPPDFDRQAMLNIDQKTEEKVRLFQKMTLQYLTYDVSSQTIRDYMRSKNREWVDRVVAIRKGDCDVLNGFLALLLRKVKVPSRLVIGYVVQNGEIEASRLHAWCEYFVQGKGWQPADLTEHIYPRLIPPGTRPPPQGEAVSSRDQPGRTPPGNLPGKILGYIRGNAYFLIAVLFFGLMGAFFAKKVLLYHRSRRYKKEFNTEPVIADLAVTALKNPQIWGYESKLWDLAIIPSVNRGHLSLKDLVRMSLKKRLVETLFTSDENFLLQYLRSEYTMVFLRARQFRKLFRLLPANSDPDAVYSHIREYYQRFERMYGKFFEILESIAGRVFKQRVRFYLIDSPDHPRFTFYNLKKLLNANPFGRRFVVINHRFPLVQDILNNYVRDHRSQFLMVHRVLQQVLLDPRSAILFPPPDSGVLQGISRYLLGRAGKEGPNGA